MTASWRTVIAVLTALGLLVVGAPAPGAGPEAAARASLTVTPGPGAYVAGQKMTFSGSIGVKGKRRLRLQFHMNRPGDRWADVTSFKGASTDAKGRFRFTFPAPAMLGVSYRVVSGKHATPRHTFRAQSQEVIVRAGADNRVTVGRPFTVTVDTAPSQKGRADLPPPVIPGRTVFLQKRVNGDQWQIVGRDVTDARGLVTFSVQEDTPGTVVYRAVEDDWTRNGDRIGWFPSFPTYVEVLGAGAPRAGATRLTAPAARTAAAPVAGRSPNASQNYRWGRALFDFAWEFGESLTSPPYRGTRLRGRWLDVTDGTGRANHNNGGVGLDSSAAGARATLPDRGTTSVTLKGNAQKYGRWEIRMRSLSRESAAQDYWVRMELVPERAADYHCGAQNITIARYRIHDRSITVGANALARNRSWTYTKRSVALENTSHNFGVEVAKDHITWFLDGSPIAAVRSRDAVSDVPMTLRLVLEGDGETEMNRTRSIYDWQRAWTLKSGKQVKRAPGKMTVGTHDETC